MRFVKHANIGFYLFLLIQCVLIEILVKPNGQLFLYTVVFMTFFTTALLSSLRSKMIRLLAAIGILFFLMPMTAFFFEYERSTSMLNREGWPLFLLFYFQITLMVGNVLYLIPLFFKINLLNMPFLTNGSS